MKLKTPDGYEIEMTTEEFLKIAPGLAARLGQAVSGGTEEGLVDAEVDGRTIIRRVLDRRSIPNGQKELFRALLEAGEAGLTQKELAARMSRTVRQLNGVLGAFGRRIANTEGSNSGIGLLLHVSNRRGVWHYQMKSELREVLLESDYEWLTEAQG